MFAVVRLIGLFFLTVLSSLNGQAAEFTNTLPRSLQSDRNSVYCASIQISHAITSMHQNSSDHLCAIIDLAIPTTDSAQPERISPVDQKACHQDKWQIDAWHGWMDAPYWRSKWQSFGQTGVLGETHLVGRYPAALGIRFGRKGQHVTYGLHWGYRKHFTQRYVVARLLEEKRYTSTSVLAWAEKKYFNKDCWSMSGLLGLGIEHQATHLPTGLVPDIVYRDTRLGMQITPLLVRLHHRQWGGLLGLGFGSAGILQTGLSYSWGNRRTFLP
jgi:hypothetical protein